MQGERGSATLIAVAMIASLIAVTVAGAQIGAAVIARHRAQAAADLAALAGAAHVPAGPDATCANVSVLARAMGAIAAACSLDGLDVEVTVEVSSTLGLFPMGPARAVARAGPADSTG